MISSDSLSQSASLLVPSSSLSSGETTSGTSTVLSPHSTSPVIPTGSSSSTSSAINGISTNGTSNASFDTSHSNNLGSIFGGAIGALALIIFVILIILFLRRRRKRSQEADALLTVPQQYIPTPPTYSSSQYTGDEYESTNNTNTSFSLSLTQNHRIPPNDMIQDMIQVGNATPLLIHGKGTPPLQLETQATHLSPLSMAGNNLISSLQDLYELRMVVFSLPRLISMEIL